MNDQRLYGALGIFGVALILGCFIGWYIKPDRKCEPCGGNSASVEIKLDTNKLVFQHEPINITGKARVQFATKKAQETIVQDSTRVGPVWSVQLP